MKASCILPSHSKDLHGYGKYTQHTPPHPAILPPPPSPPIKEFATEILCLLNHYITPLPKRTTPHPALHNHHTYYKILHNISTNTLLLLHSDLRKKKHILKQDISSLCNFY